jgi:hypothetical protein
MSVPQLGTRNRNARAPENARFRGLIHRPAQKAGISRLSRCGSLSPDGRPSWPVRAGLKTRFAFFGGLCWESAGRTPLQTARRNLMWSGAWAGPANAGQVGLLSWGTSSIRTGWGSRANGAGSGDTSFAVCFWGGRARPLSATRRAEKTPGRQALRWQSAERRAAPAGNVGDQRITGRARAAAEVDPGESRWRSR